MAALTLDVAALKAIPDDAVAQWVCVLTQENFRDLLIDCDAVDRDVLGFGIAVQRGESVVDDPTQLRIREVSLTTVARGAFEDAVAYKLADEHFKAVRGAFSLANDEIAVALRGQVCTGVDGCV
jgi:hypothetical protein